MPVGKLAKSFPLGETEKGLRSFPFGETEKGHQVFPPWGNGKGAQVVCKTLGYGKAFVMQEKRLYIYKSGNLTFTCLYNR